MIFWIQAPLALILGPIQFFAIPNDLGNEASQSQNRSLLHKLAKVDYLGALTLVCPALR